MTGQGVELDLRLTPVLEFGDFYWNVFANATFATSEVTELYGGLTELTVYDPIYAIVGEPFPYIKATDFKRDPEGRVIVDETTGLPTLGDLVPVGRTEPSVRLGLSTEFAWKGISLNATFEYRGGHVARFDSEYEMLFTGASYISAIAGRERFVFPNSVIERVDENGNVYYEENKNITVNSGGKDFWTGVYRSCRAAQVVSANSWKLRELSLTWKLPQRWMEKTKFLQSAAVSLVGRNLFYWVPDTNLWGDPDMWGGTGNRNAPGVVRNAMAGFRTFGFNINLSF
ncbi:tonB-dependent receptor plug [Alistipes sp. CAG:831]|nr:tonB-dependent receptor plug [Alistipes sp. CAG:831]